MFVTKRKLNNITYIFCFVFRWPADEIRPENFILGGPQVRVLSVQPNLSIETSAIPEIFDIITQISLPTIIKLEEVNREEILKSLKSFVLEATNVKVIHFVLFHSIENGLILKDLTISRK